MDVAARIAGAEKLITVFGYWPSFHDAEVLWIELRRRPCGEGYGPTLEALGSVDIAVFNLGGSGSV
jgi:hypothetical protein